MSMKGKADYIIEDVAGCGPFQIIILVFYIMMAKASIGYSILFMSFGNYNPGWRCLENATNVNSISNTTDPGPPKDVEYTVGSCSDYKHCANVEFNPESSTVVTEFGLLCDQEWISSLIISIQMVGMLIGSVVGGQLADMFGRKKVFYGACASCAILQLMSSFSVSWVMLTVIRFFLGIFNTFILVTLYINIAESMTLRWRAVMMALPFWYVGCTFQALIAMGFKDWRNVEQIGCVLFVLLFVPIFWVPENLRWLEVKGKTKEFIKVATKIVKCNGKEMSTNEELEKVECYKETLDTKKYTVFDLFRPGYRFKTVSVGILDMVYSLIYYALTFGVKSFYGDFYINMILVNIIAMPFMISAMFGMRFTNRRILSLILLGSSVVCSLAAVVSLVWGSGDAKATGSTILVSIARGALDAAWLVLYARITEMYPTVVRTTALGFGSLSARVGGILAPFLIPSDKSNVYIFIAISAAVILASCIISYKLPETHGVPLRETFEDRKDKEKNTLHNGSSKDQELDDFENSGASLSKNAEA